jgi:hypothetical protein
MKVPRQRVAGLVLSGVVAWLTCLGAAQGDTASGDVAPGESLSTESLSTESLSTESLSTESLSTVLSERGIAREQRAALEAAGPWDDAKQKMAIRVLARLGAPAGLALRWRAEAADVAAADVAVDDRLVRIAGRATFVAPLVLPPDQADLAARASFDLVRIVDAAGAPVDVLAVRSPAAWPRWQVIDEPAVVIGLPLAKAGGPRPSGGAAAEPPAAELPAAHAAWPDVPAVALLAATSVAWEPDTPLGRLGMDYGLFDTVTDGGKLQPGDTEAFYAVLAAAGRAPAGSIEAAAGPRTDLVPLINPAAKWFASNRGSPVTLSGVARKITRIAIDEPARREQVGADHYWEVFVFVETPPLIVDGREQDTYPVVCCVRSLPPGMPTGDRISERVTISGFALKRYGYPLADVTIISSQGDETDRGRRMETPLVIGRRLDWQPATPPAREGGFLFWIFGGIAAAVLAALALRNWAVTRRARRDEAAIRAQLPEHFSLPPQFHPSEDSRE